MTTTTPRGLPWRRLLAALLLVLLAVRADAGYIFDGTDDSIHWGDIPALSDATTLSCSAWVWNDNLTQDHAILSNSSTGAGFLWFTDDVTGSGRTDTYRIVIQESSGAGGSAAGIDGATGAATANAWQVVGFSFTGSSSTGLRLYVGGTEDANSPVTTAAVADVGFSNGNITIGERVGGTIDRAGRQAEMACWTGRIFYAPLRGTSPNIGSAGYQAGTVTGATPTANHPALYDCPGR